MRLKLGLDNTTSKSKKTDEGDISDVEYEEMEEKEPGSLFKNKIVIIAIIAAVAVIGIFLFLGNRGNSSKNTGIEAETNGDDNSETTFNTDQTEELTETESESQFNPGSVDYSDGELRTPERLDASTDFLKDLNGIEIPVSYNVKSVDYVCDYVNYAKRRASMDDGMELYWLEITYNNLHYRCTIPFWRYKSLNDEGICIVKMEVLTLEGGEKVISYMGVVDSIDD